jgi:hypothetical protein
LEGAFALDVALYKQVGGGERTAVTQTVNGRVLRFTVEIPEAYRNLGRTFFIVRVHNDVTAVLPDLDYAPGTATFETDRFSTYGIAYTDTQIVPGDPIDPNDPIDEEKDDTDFKPAKDVSASKGIGSVKEGAQAGLLTGGAGETRIEPDSTVIQGNDAPDDVAVDISDEDVPAAAGRAAGLSVVIWVSAGVAAALLAFFLIKKLLRKRKKAAE